ncbi:MAG: (d)CMP kinase [Candidatus Dormibacteria bacterium]
MTIDGASGSGKTTLGGRLAGALGLPLLDTGLFYRGVMVAAVRAGLTDADPDRLAELARRTRVEIDTDPRLVDDDAATLVDGAPAGPALRDPAHALLLSRLSGVPGVRQAILGAQRELGAGGVVAVGRDCGTVVFPNAPVKLFLRASEDLREGRRRAQLLEAGRAVSGDLLRGEIGGRDALDAGRELSPLRPADDAHIIDSGAENIEEMVATALKICAEAGLTG